jgi:hypothetical protein
VRRARLGDIMENHLRHAARPSALRAAATLALAAGMASAQALPFQKIVVTSEYLAEGADLGDFDKDGIMDLVSGAYWFEGPDFKVRHEYQAPTAYNAATDYSKVFLTWTQDVDGDGWTDIFATGVPGVPGYWYRNPGASVGTATRWTRSEALPVVGNESPAFHDVDGDGKLDLLCNTNDGYAGWVSRVPGNPTAPWVFRRITPKGNWNRFTHGLGFGDINGDGRKDLLEKEGWWEQPASLAGDPEWKRHPYVFAAAGGAQMHAHDFDGDGDMDVATTLDAHGWGLAWFEQVRTNGAISFVKRTLMGDRAAQAQYGIAFSQPHALALADMDGDGLLDLVTGKRKWAHGPDGDIEANSPYVLAVFRARRTGTTASFIPSVLDTASGVGVQLEVKDMDGDGRMDIVVGNKSGTFAFRNGGGTSTRRPVGSTWTPTLALPGGRRVDVRGVDYPTYPWSRLEAARGKILLQVRE